MNNETTPPTARAVSEVPEELAARCEATTGADRDIDFAIWYSRKDKEKLWSMSGMNAQRALWSEEDLRRTIARDPEEYGFGPRYTTSLDAAMTLVPNGVEGVPLSFKVERFYLGNGVEMCRASVWCGLGVVSSLDTASEAAMPALALTAAALRSAATLARETEAGS